MLFLEFLLTATSVENFRILFSLEDERSLLKQKYRELKKMKMFNSLNTFHILENTWFMLPYD